MPFGDFGLGYGPFGADPVYVPAPGAPVLVRRAVLYDPARKGFFLLDANGNAIDVHPVDQMVALRLTMQKGDSPSSATVGTRIRALFALAAPQKHPAIASAEVNAALADLIAVGDVKLLGVTLARNSSGAEVIQPCYVNLRDPRTNPLQPERNATTVDI